MNYIDTSHLREDIEAQLAAHFEADLCNVEVTADRAAGVVAFAHPAAVAKQFGLDPRG